VLELNRSFGTAEKHKIAIICHATFVFGLSVWALSNNNNTPQSTVHSQDKSSGSALKGTPSIMSGFAPKEAVELAPPKDDPITREELAKCSGADPSQPIYVAIKGEIVYPLTNCS
jgi:hypothetical protein